MISIDFQESVSDELGELIDREFNRYASKFDVECNYSPFVYVAREDDKLLGVIVGHSYYSEVHISDLIVLEEYRGRDIGSVLLNTVIKNYSNNGFDNINLSTYEFQARKFYEKHGFKVEFVRENKDNKNLNKYYMCYNL